MGQNQKNSVRLIASMYCSAAANRYKIRGYQYKGSFPSLPVTHDPGFFMIAINLG